MVPMAPDPTALIASLNLLGGLSSIWTLALLFLRAFLSVLGHSLNLKPCRILSSQNVGDALAFSAFALPSWALTHPVRPSSSSPLT